MERYTHTKDIGQINEMKDIGQRTLDIGQRTLSMVRPRPKPDEEFSDGVKKKRKR